VGSDGRTPLVRRALKRHAVQIVVVTLLFAVAGFALAMKAEKWTASTEILLRPTVGNAFSADSLGSTQQTTVGLETESHLINSSEMEKLVGGHTQKLLDSDDGTVSADVVLNSQILSVSFTAPDKAAAKAGAQAVASAFLQSRETRAEQVRDRQISSLQDQISQVGKDLDSASRTATSSTAPPGAQARVQLLANRLTSLQTALGAAQGLETAPGSVVTSAKITSRLAPATKYLLPVALVIFGFLVALAIAVWRSFNRDALDSRDDFTVGDVPVLVNLRRNAPVTGELLFAAGTSVATREAYRLLRSGVTAAHHPPATIAVASANTPEGCAQIAANLCASLAEAGYRVALVDAAIDQPQVQVLLGLPPGPGLADAVASENRTGALHTVGLPAFDVLPAGNDPGAAEDLYGGERFRSVLARLGSTYDFVIVVAPELSTALGTDVAAAADGTLIVVGESAATHTQLMHLVERSSARGVSFVGIVAVGTPGQTAASAAKAAKRARAILDKEGTPRDLTGPGRNRAERNERADPVSAAGE
jgi:Mrp family chromosome partitioning ATPase/capsular polysaccharide biosynthesis protein